MRRHATTILLGLAVWSAALAASGDWLITLEGQLIETAGAWTLADGNVVYTDLEGETREIALDGVDLEASEETTALRAGRPYVPSDAARELEEAEASRLPEAILYVGWRCGPCEQARELLDRLGVGYLEKNAEHRPTAKELRKKVGRRYILPVVDFDGEVVIGYRPEEIRRLVRELEHESREPAGEDAAGDEEGP